MAFVLWGALFPQALATSSQNVLDITTEKFGWFYLIATFFFLIFSLFLAFSRFGKIKLGADTDEPEYSGRSWFAMLFSAGMGIGLVFWGTAEPLSHYMNPPQGASPQSAEAARLAMRYSFFHWGLHAWAIYTVIGLAIAYFTFRKNRSGLISNVFYPLMGERVNGFPGKMIDILAIIATIFGVATSLGLGTLQINGGNQWRITSVNGPPDWFQRSVNDYCNRNHFVFNLGNYRSRQGYSDTKQCKFDHRCCSSCVRSLRRTNFFHL